MLQVWLVGWLASWCGRDKKFRTTVTLRAPFWLLLVFSLAYRKMLQKNPAKLISNGKGIQPKSTFNILHYQIFINFMFVIFHLILNYNLLLPIFAVPKAFLPVLFFSGFFFISFVILSFMRDHSVFLFSACIRNQSWKSLRTRKKTEQTLGDTMTFRTRVAIPEKTHTHIHTITQKWDKKNSSNEIRIVQCIRNAYAHSTKYL